MNNNINWYPGHMAKTKRLIKEKIDQIDIVYELVDARIPSSSKITDIDGIIKKKIRILIMTKSDLCDLSVTKKWIEYYESFGYNVLLVNLNDPASAKQIVDLTNKLTKQMQLLRVSKGLKEKELRSLVIGIPNVGKSTLINKLAGKKSTSVGNRPGVTTNLTWLKTNHNILLLDTPGILWPKFENPLVALNLASMTAIKTEVLPIEEVALHIVRTLNLYYPSILRQRYKIEGLSENAYETLEEIGKKKGCLISGGEVDYEKVSNIIINDIKDEYIKGITFDRI